MQAHNFTVVEIYNRTVQGFKNLAGTMGMHVSALCTHGFSFESTQDFMNLAPCEWKHSWH